MPIERLSNQPFHEEDIYTTNGAKSYIFKHRINLSHFQYTSEQIDYKFL